jgi:hypothetical protein
MSIFKQLKIGLQGIRFAHLFAVALREKEGDGRGDK